jgi:hypothetical protein
MTEERVDRRLAAIFAGDIAGYSRLMGADEEGTLRQLKAHRRELVDPKITEHRGRIVKTTGDGMLVEFFSVVDAVRCAVDIQRDMAERNAGVTASMWRRVWRRWPIPAASWFRASCTIKYAISSALISRTWESRRSRTSHARSAFTAFN